MALMPVADAMAAVLDGVTALPDEMVALSDAHHRVLARDIAALRTQPPADMSAMDGYAVRAADAAKTPARLKVIGEAAAGSPFDAPVKHGEAVRLRIQSRASPGQAAELRVLAEEQLVFAWTDPAPYRHGWLALRTTASHLRIKDFRVLRL